MDHKIVDRVPGYSSIGSYGDCIKKALCCMCADKGTPVISVWSVHEECGQWRDLRVIYTEFN